jgi:serine/threonine protein kinase
MTITFAAGTLIDDKYELIRKLGGGCFGDVYLAQQAGLSRQVAIKILTPDVIGDEEAIARFQREGQSLCRLTHANIVSCYGYGVIGSYPYMVLEYLEGFSLDRLLVREKRLPPQRACNLLAQVCDGLQAAHSNGIIHRDLKPSNIVVLNEGQWNETAKVVDFGLAMHFGNLGGTIGKLTKTGMVLGTCFYMSPEQCTGKHVGPASDIYAIGCILFECLTGSRPFDADSAVGVMYHHVHDNPPRLRDVAADLDRAACDLQAVVDRAMHKDAEQRYVSADEMAAALRPDLSMPSALKVSRRLKAPAQKAGSSANSGRLKSPLLIAGCIAALASIVLGCAVWLGSAKPSARADPATISDAACQISRASGKVVLEVDDGFRRVRVADPSRIEIGDRVTGQLDSGDFVRVLDIEHTPNVQSRIDAAQEFLARIASRRYEEAERFVSGRNREQVMMHFGPHDVISAGSMDESKVVHV